MTEFLCLLFFGVCFFFFLVVGLILILSFGLRFCHVLCCHFFVVVRIVWSGLIWSSPCLRCLCLCLCCVRVRVFCLCSVCVVVVVVSFCVVAFPLFVLGCVVFIFCCIVLRCVVVVVCFSCCAVLCCLALLFCCCRGVVFVMYCVVLCGILLCCHVVSYPVRFSFHGFSWTVMATYEDDVFLSERRFGPALSSTR